MKKRSSQAIKGRFFKHNNASKEILNISDFNLMEICELPVSYTDNPQGNIIHNKLHAQEEINQILKAENHLNKVFETNEQRLVIKPLDFTGEWRKHRQRLLERAHRGEEDEVDFDHEGHGNRIRQQMREILNTRRDTEETGETLQEALMETNESEKEASINESTETTGEPTAENLEELIDEHEDFVETPFESVPERAEPKIDEQHLEQVFEEAKSKGYEEGFRAGEEKAIIAANQRIAIIYEELQKVINELNTQEQSLLESSKEKFFLITKTLVESILETEFKQDSSSFLKIIEKAVRETVTSKDYKIFVSKLIYESLDQSGQDLTLINKDDSLNQYEFKIESNDMNLKSDYQQIVEQLLDEAKSIS